MRKNQFMVEDIDVVIAQLSEEFGFWRIVKAVLFACRPTGKRNRNDTAMLSDYMRRDIGLLERSRLPDEGRTHWPAPF